MYGGNRVYLRIHVTLSTWNMSLRTKPNLRGNILEDVEKFGSPVRKTRNSNSKTLNPVTAQSEPGHVKSKETRQKTRTSLRLTQKTSSSSEDDLPSAQKTVSKPRRRLKPGSGLSSDKTSQSPSFAWEDETSDSISFTTNNLRNYGRRVSEHCRPLSASDFTDYNDDDDDDDSLFITQKSVSQTSKETNKKSSSKSTVKSKKGEKKKFTIKTHKFNFPFLKKGNNAQNLQFSSSQYVSLNSSLMEGFFNSLRSLVVKNLGGEKQKLSYLEGDVTPLGENSEGDEEIQVVRKSCLTVFTKAKATNASEKAAESVNGKTDQHLELLPARPRSTEQIMENNGSSAKGEPSEPTEDEVAGSVVGTELTKDSLIMAGTEDFAKKKRSSGRREAVGSDVREQSSGPRNQEEVPEDEIFVGKKKRKSKKMDLVVGSDVIKEVSGGLNQEEVLKDETSVRAEKDGDGEEAVGEDEVEGSGSLNQDKVHANETSVKKKKRKSKKMDLVVGSDVIKEDLGGLNQEKVLEDESFVKNKKKKKKSGVGEEVVGSDVTEVPEDETSVKKKKKKSKNRDLEEDVGSDVREEDLGEGKQEEVPEDETSFRKEKIGKGEESSGICNQETVDENGTSVRKKKNKKKNRDLEEVVGSDVIDDGLDRLNQQEVLTEETPVKKKKKKAKNRGLEDVVGSDVIEEDSGQLNQEEVPEDETSVKKKKKKKKKTKKYLEEVVGSDVTEEVLDGLSQEDILTDETSLKKKKKKKRRDGEEVVERDVREEDSGSLNQEEVPEKETSVRKKKKMKVGEENERVEDSNMEMCSSVKKKRKIKEGTAESVPDDSAETHQKKKRKRKEEKVDDNIAVATGSTSKKKRKKSVSSSDAVAGETQPSQSPVAPKTRTFAESAELTNSGVKKKSKKKKASAEEREEEFSTNEFAEPKDATERKNCEKEQEKQLEAFDETGDQSLMKKRKKRKKSTCESQD